MTAPSIDLTSMDSDDSSRPASIADMYFKSKELEKQGVNIIHLDVGEPDFEPPPEVVAATQIALSTFKSKYTVPAGIYELRSAIASHLNSIYKTEINPEQVLFTAGGRLAMYMAFLSLPKRASVGIITPDWPAYRDMCELLGLTPVYFHTTLEGSWAPDLSKIASGKFDALVLNYPNNPTGKILDPKVLNEISRIIEEKNAMLISDEVYSDYVFEKPFRSILQVNHNIRSVLVTSLSKSYSMTGYRSGYVVSDKTTISNMERISSVILTSAPEFVQHAALAALNCKDYVLDKVNLIKARKEIASKTLRESGHADFYEPDGSLYIFPKIRGSKGRPIDSEELALDLLERGHVSVTPGTVFGSPFREYIRITLLQNEDRLKEGIEIIGKTLETR